MPFVPNYRLVSLYIKNKYVSSKPSMSSRLNLLRLNRNVANISSETWERST